MVVPIGVLKLAKAAALVAIGVAGLALQPETLAGAAEHVVDWVGGLPGHQILHRVASKLWSLEESKEKWLALGALCYAAVFVVEGVGLVLEKTWAEWLTVVVTASFIPIEIYEIAAHFGIGKVVALALNVAVVAYLAWVRWSERARGRA
jgi:uncharacterized membrane protein (DUF2068 family)